MSELERIERGIAARERLLLEARQTVARIEAELNWWAGRRYQLRLSLGLEVEPEESDGPDDP